MKIQASIAEAFRKQSEVIGRKSTAKATAAAFVRRSRRNIRANGHSTYFRGRGRASSDDAALACSDDEEDGNGENGGKEESSAEESSPEKKQKRPPKWPTPRSSPARAACNEEVASDDKDDVGISEKILAHLHCEHGERMVLAARLATEALLVQMAGCSRVGA